MTGFNILSNGFDPRDNKESSSKLIVFSQEQRDG